MCRRADVSPGAAVQGLPCDPHHERDAAMATELGQTLVDLRLQMDLRAYSSET
jgi:hypothetical protein